MFGSLLQEDPPNNKQAFSADGAAIGGSVFLSEDFSAKGEVRLPLARIGGDLDCSRGTFRNKGGLALLANRADIKGSIFLNDGFKAEGEVQLNGVHVGGDIGCVGGTFQNRHDGDLQSRTALLIDAGQIRGSVFLRTEGKQEFLAEGQVRLPGVRIGGDLDCHGGKFRNPRHDDLPESGWALFADRASVTGSVFLRDGFDSEGEVRIAGARIGGDLDCRQGKFSKLNAQSTTVGAQIVLATVCSDNDTETDLMNASAACLADDEGAWPSKGKLYLDGFVYGRISSGTINVPKRLKWLSRQAEFTAQPYRQLARVLREEGDEGGARLVLVEMEHQFRQTRGQVRGPGIVASGRELWRKLVGRVCAWVLTATIGYGYHPARAGWWLSALILAGWLSFGLGYSRGYMTPSDKNAYIYFKAKGWSPPYYQQFTPLVYSLENSVPVLRLGQDSAWMADPSLEAYKGSRWWWTMPTALRLLRRVQIVGGWILVTLFLSGVTGLIRKE
jgi:hypothetical protein